jgi:flagellar motor switch protein FliG
MGPDNAARVMKLMAEEDKGEVTVRMARLKRIPGELIDDVTLAITGALGRDDDFLDVGGVDRTARMLGRLPKTENDRILEVVADEDNPLAERLRRRMVLFGDLMTLTNRGIQTLLKQVDRDDLILALKGGTVAEVDRFLENVSSRAAEDIREEIEIMGPVPKSRTRSAQERIVATALKLAEEGSIYLAIGANEEDEDE